MCVGGLVKLYVPVVAELQFVVGELYVAVTKVYVVLMFVGFEQ